MTLYKILVLLALGQSMVIKSMEPEGTFTPVPGSPFPARSVPQGIAFSPITTAGELFVAVPILLNTPAVIVFKVDQSTGVVSQISGSFPAGSNPYAIAFSPIATTGKLFVAVANQGSSNISVYEVDQTNGILDEISGSPFPAGTLPYGIAFSPITTTGKLFAAVACLGSDSVFVYEVDQTSGAFIPTSPPSFTANDAVSIAFSPITSMGKLFAASANEGGEISVYEVNQTSGVFTLVAPPLVVGSTIIGIAFSPLPVGSGKLLAAVTAPISNSVFVYEVDQTSGVFTEVPYSPFAADVTPVSVAFSPLASGELFAAVANQDSNNVSVYVVDQATGVFAPVYGPAFVAGDQAEGVAFSPLVSGDNLFAGVVGRSDNTLWMYRVTTPPPTPPPAPASYGPAAPINIFGRFRQNIFLDKTETIITITWNAGDETYDEVVAYRIYNGSTLIATISATSPLTFTTLVTAFASFSIAAVDAYGLESAHVPVVIV